MKISKKVWDKYIARLRKLDEKAGALIESYLATHVIEDGYDLSALMAYCYAVATKYGEGAAALSAEMYDAIAALSDVYVPPAIPAQTVTYQETATAVQGARLFSTDPKETAGVVARLVKQASADTTLQNAQRDGVEFAWIPHGDTCAFCLTLASRGWQHISRRTLRNGHAEHIHNNCDCTYAIRFDDDTDVEGYDPEKYAEWYYSEPGSPKAKINAMRREIYAENKDRINAQKRSAYARRKFLNSSAAEELNVD